MPQRKHHWLGCAGLLLCTFAIVLKAQPASAEVAYAVTETNKLIRFDTGQAGETNVGTISGTVGGEQILSIDFRPLTGRLYGVSALRLYTINPVTAQAEVASQADFPVPLSGNVDMDFDPVSGFIRVVTDTNQNLRINPQNGAVTTDTVISGVAGLAGLAYTNNFASPDRATLFAISPTTDQLARVGGVDLTDGGASQAAGAATPIGLLSVDVTAPAGFDIAANDNDAFAVLTPTGDTQSGLYRINLASGAATLVRQVLVGERLRGLALLSRAVTIYTLGQPTVEAPGGFIGTILSAAPGSPQSQTRVSITGLSGSEVVVDIDVRPATGQLVGITQTGRLMIINPLTGQTTALSTVNVAIEGSVRAMDFNPLTDRLRIIGDNGQNLSVVPDTGVATEQTDLDVTTIVAAAYDAAGALYAITDTQVVRFADPSTGVSTPVSTHAAIFGPATAFDISPADGTGFIAQDAIPSTATGLFSLQLPDGALSNSIGNLPAPGGTGQGYSGIAIAPPGRVRFSVDNYSTLESAGALVTVQREAGSSGPVTVQLTVAAGTATAPTDFIAFNATLELADGLAARTIVIPVLNDTLDESDETVTLTLTQPGLGATLGTPAAATLTIVDNDPLVGGAAPTVTITSPTADPTFTASSLFITLAGEAEDADGTVTQVAWSSDRGGFGGTASIGAAAASVDWYATDVQLAPGVNTITVSALDNSGNIATDVIVVTVNDLSYYLAEGATGTFFDLDLLLANPNSVPVNITATFLKPGGQGTVVQQYTLPATSRSTVSVDAIQGLEGAEVSTVVTASASTPIVVERTMRWNETGYGAHTDKASPSTSTKWYFAEGSQGFFFTYLLLANPHNAANQVSVTYLRENVGPITRQYDLDPLERFTVDLGADADLVNQSFGMEVTFTLPGIAERAMYFGIDPLWIGGHESMGVTLPSRNWFLAEGATGTFFETFVLLANPSATTATATVRYLPDTGTPIEKEHEVPPGQRVTLNIQAEDPALVNAAVATQVTSDVPIIVERAQYWPDPAPNWYEAHNSFGVTATATRWGLAEGRVGLSLGYQTYILLANPNNNDVEVSITFLREDGTTLLKNITVQASSRFNVAVGGPDVPEITNGQFSAVVTSSLPIAVERAMYSDLNGATWQAGTNATATRLP